MIQKVGTLRAQRIAEGKQGLPELSAELNRLSEIVIGCAIQVHRELGPGLLERIYVDALCIELDDAGIQYRREAPINVSYKGRTIGNQRLDLLIEDQLVIESKAIERIPDVALAQLVSYLRMANLSLGLLINFNVPLLKDGIYRRINTTKNSSLRSSASSAFKPPERPKR